MQGVSGRRIINGLGWVFSERLLAQGVSFVVSILLARLLSPSDYGTIALVLVFINLADVFVSNGFGEALIQRKYIDFEDYSTMFWCSFIFSGALYGLLFFFAPYISAFYDDLSLTLLIRVLAIRLPISAINTIQHAYVSHNMLFEKFFISTLGGTVISGIVGVLLAYEGYGIWALIAQYLINSIIDTVVLLFTIPWRPKCTFNKKHAVEMLGFSWRITGASLINTLYSELRSLIIGKVYSVEDLALYKKGDQFPCLLISNINTAFNSVYFPVLSSLQDNNNELKKAAKRAIKVSSYILFPLLFGLIAIGDDLIELLLTKKWLPCIFYLRVLCFYWMTQPLQTINWQILKATGKSGLCLKLEIVKKIIGFALILVTMYISVEVLAISTALFAIISMIINMVPNKRLISYSFFEQIKDVGPNFLISGIMSFITWCISGLIDLPLLLSVIIEVGSGCLIYILLSVITKNSTYRMLIEGIKASGNHRQE